MEFKPNAGGSIWTISQEASDLSKKHGQNVQFSFNGINLEITPISNPDDIAIIYHLKHKIRQLTKGH